MSLGERINKLRTEKNLSQGDLANALDVSRQSISKWETNASVPELDKLIKIAELFEVSLDELVGKSPIQTKQTEYPPVEIPVNKGMEPQKVAGILLLGFGLLAFILFSALSFNEQLRVDFEYALLLGIPLIVCGVICLVCKRHPGYFCALAIYMMIWFPVTVLMDVSFGTIGWTVHIALMIYGLGLLIFTIVRFRSLRILTAFKSIIIVLLAFFLIVRVAAMVPPREQQAITGDEYIKIPSQSVSPD